MENKEEHNNIVFENSEQFNSENTASNVYVRINIESVLGRQISSRLERGYEMEHSVLRIMETLYQMIPYRGECIDDQYIYGCSGFEYLNAIPSKLSPDYTWKYVEFEGCTPRFPSNGSTLAKLWQEVVKNRVSFNDIVNEIGLDSSECRIYEMFYYMNDDIPNDEGRFYIVLSYKKDDLLEKLFLLNKCVKEVSFSEYNKYYEERKLSGSDFYPLYMREIFFNKSTPKETLERLFNCVNEED